MAPAWFTFALVVATVPWVVALMVHLLMPSKVRRLHWVSVAALAYGAVAAGVGVGVLLAVVGSIFAAPLLWDWGWLSVIPITMSGLVSAAVLRQQHIWRTARNAHQAGLRANQLDGE